jgi:hypothetical protein
VNRCTRNPIGKEVGLPFSIARLHPRIQQHQAPSPTRSLAGTSRLLVRFFEDCWSKQSSPFRKTGFSAVLSVKARRHITDSGHASRRSVEDNANKEARSIASRFVISQFVGHAPSFWPERPGMVLQSAPSFPTRRAL